MAHPVLEHTYARDVPDLSLPWRAAVAPDPDVVIVNDDLAVSLGFDSDWLRSPAGIAFLTGHGEGADGRAQAYAGHQFGHYSPRLGDGRALLLGELVDPRGQRHDLHLKGSGRTPFSRGGDGYAALGPMLREHLVGEALHALGIPTTRALAVIATGSPVARETLLPGAVLCRVAESHLRVGTFQYAAASGDLATLRALADHAIDRHHPTAREAANPYLGLLRDVVAAQADLVARWMLAGFIHGVMNTDNMTISGESIDFGPCAFLDAYDPATVFSSIDHHGRYAYGNQPSVALWNLARFAEALLPLIASTPDEAVEPALDVLGLRPPGEAASGRDAEAPRLHGFSAAYEGAYAAGLAGKLGLAAPAPELGRDLVELLAAHRIDWTGFFAGLADGTARDHFSDPTVFDVWEAGRTPLLAADHAERMRRANPVVIPRNHRVEEALAAATSGDLAPYERLARAVAAPFDRRAGEEDLWGPAPDDAPAHVTYCGT